MELKSQWISCTLNGDGGSNRTFMELKYARSEHLPMQ